MARKYKLALAGDVCLAGPLFKEDWTSFGDQHSFGPRLRATLDQAEVLHLNLEMVLTQRTEPQSDVLLPFAMDPESARILVGLGVRHASVANNHALDFGLPGLQDTTACLDRHGIAWSGTAERPFARVGSIGFLCAFLVEPGEAARFRGALNVVEQDCRADRERLLLLVEELARQSEWVVLSLHHHHDFLAERRLPEWCREVAIEAGSRGAHVVHFHGAHHMLGLEKVDQTLLVSGCGGLNDDFGSNFASLSLFRRAYPGVIPDDFPLPASGRSPVTLAHPEYRTDLGYVVLLDPERQVTLVPTRVDNLVAEIDEGTGTWRRSLLTGLNPLLELHPDGRVEWRETAGFEFTGVDQSSRPDSAVRYLDMFSTLSQVAAYKTKAIARLELKPGERVLEVGCGLGADLLLLAEQVGPQGRVVGVDASETLLGEARQRLPETIELVVALAENLPFPDGTFDAVRFDRILLHLPDVGAALREAKRVLRAGGRWVATEPDWDTLTLAASDREAVRSLVHASCDAHPSGWVGRELPGLAHQLGFEEIDVGLESILVSRLALADQMYELQDSLQRAVETGQLDEERAGLCLQDLRKRDAEGRFFCSLTGIGVRARKAR